MFSRSHSRNTSPSSSAEPDIKDIYNRSKESGSENQSQRQIKKSRPHETTPLAPPQISTTVKPFHLPTAHLKRAVANNLPCFYIKFDSHTTQRSIPPAMKVARWIRQTIQQQSSEPIGDFSILIPVGTNRYKFGVTSKNDFLLLWNSDANEYEEILKIGRIAIGHLLLPITAFLPGVKLTYCSNCWMIGHTKPECKINPRCRKCLDDWEFNHHCQKPILCAQCEGPYLSTSIECPVVYNHRITLKDQVRKAINDGLISQPSINQKRAAARYVENVGLETKQINGAKQAWGRQLKSTDRPQMQPENENDQLCELVCRTKDVLDIIRRMELKMDNQ
ncbi:unnamed protein product, partial [Rotaria sp. Silwood1]